MNSPLTLGVHKLKGEAVRRLRTASDDNHAEEASEKEALANFRSLAPSFFETQQRFIKDIRQRNAS